MKFKNNNPIYIEIGTGKGSFIIEKAKKYPNINFIGIEKFDSVMVKVVEKQEELLKAFDTVIIGLNVIKEKLTKK